MRLIPAIDIINGKCVRLSRGDYSTQKIYNENPLEVAKMFEAHGVQYLHLVDLDGAKASHIVNYKILEQIAAKTSLKIDFGGGLKSDEDLKIAFGSGANQITGGSIAVKNPELFKSWVQTYGAGKIILGADAKNQKVAVGGWLEESDKKVLPFIQNYVKQGVSYVICTDIAKDGMLQGPSFSLYKKIIKETKDIFIKSISNSSLPVPIVIGRSRKVTQGLQLIASGGVSCFEDLPKLADLGCEGAIIGKAIYEKKISVKQIEDYIVSGS